MKYIVLSILFYLMYSGAQAQYTVRISVQGSATGCIGVLTGNNVSGTLKRSDGTVITTTSNSGASSFVVATSGGSSNSLSFLVSGSGSYACDCRDPFDPTSQIPGCITSGGASRSEVALNVSLSLGACGLNTTSVSSSNYTLTITVTAFTGVSAPSIAPLSCSNFNTIGLTAAGAGPYDWQVADESQSVWVDFRIAAAGTVTTTYAELSPPGITGDKRFVRVFDRTCSVLSAPSTQILLFFPAPNYNNSSVSATSPSCRDGTDGGFQVNFLTPPAWTSMFVTLAGPGGENFQVPISGNTTISSNTFIGIAIGPGNWQVKVINFNGGNCSGPTITVNVPNPPPITYSLLSSQDVRCNNDANGQFQISISGGTGPYSFSPSTLPTPGGPNNQPVFSGLGVGSYTVTVKDAANCTGSGPAIPINQPNPLVASIAPIPKTSGYEIACHGGTANATASAVGGNGGYTYAWTGGAITATAALTVGSKTVTVTDSKGCIDIEDVILTEPLVISATFNIVNRPTGFPLLCPNGTDGQATVIPSGGVSPYTYVWDNASTSNFRADLTAGTHGVTITDANNCPSPQSVNITPPPAMVPTFTPTLYLGRPISCVGATDGEVSVTVANGVAPYSFDWSSGELINHIDNKGAGDYLLEITDNYNCKINVTYTFSNPPPITPLPVITSDYNGAAISCFGRTDASLNATVINAVGTVTYQWQGGPAAPAYPNVGAGTYKIMVTDGNNCYGEQTIPVVAPAPAAVAINVLTNYNGSDISCAGQSDANIRAAPTGGTAPYTYLWEDGSLLVQRNSLPAGTYSVVATDVNGCQSSADKTVIDPEPVNVGLVSITDFNGYQVSCAGSHDGRIEVTGTGGTGAYNYTWAGGPLSAVYDNRPIGTYSVVVSDANGCSNNRSFTLIEPSPLTLSMNSLTPVSCFYGRDGVISLTAGGSVPAYEFTTNNVQWQSSNSFSGLTTGNYPFAVRDQNRCVTNLAPIHMPEPPVITVNFTNVIPALCDDPRGSATGVIAGGVGGYTYRWADFLDNTVGTGPVLNNVTSGVYTLNIRDANNCPMKNNIGITSLDGATTQVGYATDASCFDSADGKARVDVTGGNGPFTILWPDLQRTNEVLNLRRGNYYVAVTDVNRCTVVQPVVINSPEQLQITTNQVVPASCLGRTDGSVDVSVAGGTPSYIYTWSSGSAAPKVTGLAKGTYNLTVIDAKNCTATSSYIITEPPLLEVSLTDQKIPTCFNGCDGALTTLAKGGNGGYTYQWQGGPRTEGYTSICAGDYIMNVTDTKGCTVQGRYTLADQRPIVINLGGSITLCDGQSHTLDPGPWAGYSWTSTNGFTSDRQRVIITKPGTYSVEITSREGCKATGWFDLITSLDLLQAQFILAQKAVVADTVVFIDVSWPVPDSVTWYPPVAMKKIITSDRDTDLRGQFARTGSYTMGMRAYLGECRDYIEKTIEVLERPTGGRTGGRLGYAPELIYFTLSPNPNSGLFETYIELAREQAITLTVIESTSGKIIKRTEQKEKAVYTILFDIGPLSSGLYVLRLDYSTGTDYIRFIVR